MSSENILSHFWDLASTDERKRLKAASQLLCALDQAQKRHKTEDEVCCSQRAVIFAKKACSEIRLISKF